MQRAVVGDDVGPVEEERSSSSGSSGGKSWSFRPLWVMEMDTPLRRNAQETHTPRQRVAQEATEHPDWSDKALDVLLDFTQIFGAVSLLEAAQGMRVIARQLPRAYVGVGFLWSFFAVSILHTVSAALELFEAEFEKNWAVLGLNWTVNFSGLLLFMIANIAVGDFSIPRLSMIAPAIQTVVLAYALRKVPGKAGGIRAVLFMANIVVLVGYAIYIHEITWGVENLCTDTALYRFDSDDTDVYERYAVYIPGDCFDVGRLFGDSVVRAHNSSDETQYFVGATTTLTSSTTWLELLNEFPVGFDSGEVIDHVMVALAGVSIVLVGGSFVNLIVASRWPLKNPSNTQEVLKALIVFGWVGIYPVFELFRVLRKLLRWLKCLSSNLKGGRYKFELDGKIVLSPQAELDAPAS